ADVRRAARRQVLAARALGVAPTHLDAHRHAFLVPRVYRAVAAEARSLSVRGIRFPAPLGSLRAGLGAPGLAKGALLFAAGIALRGIPRAYGLAAAAGLAVAWAAPPRARADDGGKPAAGKAAPGPAAGTKVVRDVEYARPGGVAVHLDLYLPEKPKALPLPLVVWVHGGGWIGGAKEPCATVGFVALGYATASVEYRLSSVAPFPAQIEDVKAAIRWPRAHAKEYGVDPQRI